MHNLHTLLLTVTTDGNVKQHARGTWPLATGCESWSIMQQQEEKREVCQENQNLSAVKNLDQSHPVGQFGTQMFDLARQ